MLSVGLIILTCRINSCKYRRALHGQFLVRDTREILVEIAYMVKKQSLALLERTKEFTAGSLKMTTAAI